MGEQNKQAWSNEWAHVNQYNNQAVSIFILYITIQTGINVKSDYSSVYDIDFWHDFKLILAAAYPM